jgi:hypothetical protein
MKRLFFVLAVSALAVGLTTWAGAASGKFKATSSLSTPSALDIQPVSGQPRPTSNPAIGDPATFAWHGGPVMGTPSTGPVVVTPIYWQPSGHPMQNQYTQIISRYLSDVAFASGTHSNVFATMNEYSGSNGQISYQVKFGSPISDSGPLPASSCNVGPLDTTGIYKDGSGYDACLDDAQVAAETQRVVAANHLPIDYGHIYVLYLPQHVESCFFASDTTANPAVNACTINHYPSAAYCAYHNQDTSNGLVYANMPFPIYQGSVPFTCGSNSNRNFGTIESPSGNPNADVEISPTSHEIMESITDPDTATGWYDNAGFENGDECAYVYGPSYGKPGALYNQVIHNHIYLTQEEFSLQDWNATHRGCRQTQFGF